MYEIGTAPTPAPRPEADRAPVWDISVPTRPSRIPGVRMAGFRDRGHDVFTLRTIPYPAVTLVINIGDAPLVVTDAAGRRHHGSVVVGTAPGLRAHGAGVELVQVRMSPLVSTSVLGIGPAEVGNRLLSPEDLWGAGATRLRDRLHEAPSWADRLAVTDEWLVRHRAPAQVSSEVAWAWREITSTRGRVRVEELADTLGWSRKRLWSRFRTEVGRSPKDAARLVRFNHAAHLLAEGVDPATTAAFSGYVDQSHLHRDVVAFSGVTPARVGSEPWLAVDRTAWS